MVVTDEQAECGSVRQLSTRDGRFGVVCLDGALNIQIHSLLSDADVVVRHVA